MFAKRKETEHGCAWFFVLWRDVIFRRQNDEPLPQNFKSIQRVWKNFVHFRCVVNIVNCTKFFETHCSCMFQKLLKIYRLQCYCSSYQWCKIDAFLTFRCKLVTWMDHCINKFSEYIQIIKVPHLFSLSYGTNPSRNRIFELFWSAENAHFWTYQESSSY